MSDYTFDPAQAREGLIAALRALAKEQGFSRVVLGVSGGKDSTVAAALCARALGKENVFGLMLPDGEQKDIADSRRVCAALGIQSRTVNIGAMHKGLLAQFEPEKEPEDGEFAVSFSRESNINVGPRLRMTALRYAAQALGARLVGTGNLSESTVGYCTKDGDTSCDFSLLGSLTTVEVVAVGLTMEELPRQLVEKTPSDGLSGMSDEEKLGVSYRAIHDYIRHGTSGDGATDAKIRRMEAASAHKRRMPLILRPF